MSKNVTSLQNNNLYARIDDSEVLLKNEKYTSYLEVYTIAKKLFILFQTVTQKNNI